MEPFKTSDRKFPANSMYYFYALYQSSPDTTRDKFPFIKNLEERIRIKEDADDLRTKAKIIWKHMNRCDKQDVKEDYIRARWALQEQLQKTQAE